MEGGHEVWFLNHYAISPDMAGGTRHYDLARELVKRGYAVTIFASGFDHVTRRYAKVSAGEQLREEYHNGVRFVWLRTTPYQGNDWRRVLNMLSYGFGLWRCSGKFEKPDVILGSSMHPVAPLVGWWLAKRFRARFIFEVRDLWPQTAVDMGAIKRTGLLARVLYAWERFMYATADKVVVVPPHASGYIAGRGIDPKKIVWIPNGVDLERFDHPEPIDPASTLGRTFGKYMDKFKVVYTGAHGSANGLETMIDAAGLLVRTAPDIHFFFVGDGPEKPKLIRRAREQSATNVTFLDPVPKSQVAAILRQSDLLVHCLKGVEIQKYGVSPNKLYDYLASGRPVIMAGSAANRVVEEAGAGLAVEADSPEALAQGILQIKQMPLEERLCLGANGRAYVERYHSTRVLGEILAQVLEGPR